MTGSVEFSVVRVGQDYFLKKTEEIKPHIESHIYSGRYKEVFKLWGKLVRHGSEKFLEIG